MLVPIHRRFKDAILSRLDSLLVRKALGAIKEGSQKDLGG